MDKKLVIIIIAVVLVVVIIPIMLVAGLVIAGLGLQVMNQGSGVPETSSKAAWKAAEPLGIIDWSRTGDTLTLVLRNNSYETINLEAVSLGEGTPTGLPFSNLASGASKTITISGLSSCKSGTKYAIPKQNISIEYTTKTITINKVQKGIADIVGTC